MFFHFRTNLSTLASLLEKPTIVQGSPGSERSEPSSTAREGKSFSTVKNLSGLIYHTQ